MKKISELSERKHSDTSKTSYHHGTPSRGGLQNKLQPLLRFMKIFFHHGIFSTVEIHGWNSNKTVGGCDSNSNLVFAMQM
jgi:hypothetical protein